MTSLNFCFQTSQMFCLKNAHKTQPLSSPHLDQATKMIFHPLQVFCCPVLPEDLSWGLPTQLVAGLGHQDV